MSLHLISMKYKSLNPFSLINLLIHYLPVFLIVQV
jgi:hypothetical protein